MNMHANTNLVQGSKRFQRPGSSRAVPDGTLAVKLAKPTSNTYERLNKERYVNRGKEVIQRVICENIRYQSKWSIKSSWYLEFYGRRISWKRNQSLSHCNRTKVHAIHL